MPTTSTLDRKNPGGAIPARGPRLRAARENEMTMLGQDPSRERISGTVPDELAARVRALRRARREAQTRASRVRRVLLAPTASDKTY
ncbi:hypothetical protein [Actinomadura rubrisoli]|uniref:Uncharacterized protein n=1 Tax=Actinomadura rubrisoli TaxID=2530368 RepID=A0A4R5BYB8_9ACTN|nr:hypothetical protein [Actinomadura rubrisoli]TDD89352.1 hypothetical protein E1298_14155 [Actinomadura rubrisoli]